MLPGSPVQATRAPRRGAHRSSGGVDESGHLVVMEVWDTPEHQARFMESRLGEALAKGGITEPPTSVTWIELIVHHHPGD